MAQRQDPISATPRTRGTLNRAEIAIAATALIERDGIDKLTMRALAGELNCGTMTLYTHVRNRDDLLAAVIEHLISELDVPGELRRQRSTWQELLADLHHSYRRLSLRFPRSFELLALAPWETQPVMLHLDRIVESLESFGLSHEFAVTALRVSDSFSTGHLLVHARRLATDPDARPSDAAPDQSDEAFETGLRIVLAGLTTECPRSAET